MKQFLTGCFALLAGCFATLAQPVADTLAQIADTVPPAPVENVQAAPQPSAETLWDTANTAYINDDFHAAAQTYEQILATGTASAKLYYNLANAYFKQEALGKAIVFYHRALRLEPNNGDIRYNLSVAEARTKDNIEAIPDFFLVTWMRDIRHLMGCTSWSILSLVMLACALSLAMLYLLSRRLSLRKAGFYGTALAALLFVLTAWFAWGERCEVLDRSSGVVMPLSTAVKSSPDRSATDIFVLHEGTLVQIESQLEGWYEIVIADGKKGWIEARKIEVI